MADKKVDKKVAKKVTSKKIVKKIITASMPVKFSDEWKQAKIEARKKLDGA